MHADAPHDNSFLHLLRIKWHHVHMVLNRCKRSHSIHHSEFYNAWTLQIEMPRNIQLHRNVNPPSCTEHKHQEDYYYYLSCWVCSCWVSDEMGWIMWQFKTGSNWGLVFYSWWDYESHNDVQKRRTWANFTGYQHEQSSCWIIGDLVKPEGLSSGKCAECWIHHICTDQDMGCYDDPEHSTSGVEWVHP